MIENSEFRSADDCKPPTKQCSYHNKKKVKGVHLTAPPHFLTKNPNVMNPKMGLIAGLIVAGTTVYLTEFNDSVQKESAKKSTIAVPAQLVTLEQKLSGQKSVDSLLASLGDRKQTFFLDGVNGKQIAGKNGTICLFPDSAFIRPDGTFATGDIKIELIECYNLKNILAAQLSTTSKNDLIETAGMINVVATENGKALRIAPGKNYTLQFPRQEQNDFVLFTGERSAQGIMDWTLIEDTKKPVELQSSKSNVITELDKNPFKNSDFIEIRHSYMRKHLGIITLDDHFRWKLQNGQNFSEYYLSNFNPSLEMVQDFHSNNLTCEITFKVNADGEVIQSYISKTSYTDWDQSLLQFVQSLPPLQVDLVMPTYVYDHDIKLEFARGMKTVTEGFVGNYRKLNQWESGGQIANVNSTDLNYYIFNISELGWINCDRFTDEKDLVDFQVQASNIDSCKMSLIFDDMNSIIAGIPNGEYVVFKNVPKNKKVRIFALKCMNGAATLCNQPAVVNDKKPVTVSNFQPFTLKQLDETLRACEFGPSKKNQAKSPSTSVEI